MNFFSLSSVPQIKEYMPPFGYWDKRLYEAFFACKPTELESMHGRSFRCVLSSRSNLLKLGMRPEEEYLGQAEWATNESEICKISVHLEVQDPEYWLTRHIKDCNLGWMAFGWRSTDICRPSLDIRVKDENLGGKSFSGHLSQLFAEVKAVGGKGVEVSWSAKLEPMLGASAEVVWGDWVKDSPRNDEGVLVPGRFPGRHAFQLESIEFKAVI